MKVFVIGLGRIGLVAACCLAKSGHNVTGIEINSEKLAQIKSGTCPFYEPGISELLSALTPTGRLEFAGTMPDRLEAKAVMITVNSPSSPDGSANLAQVQSAVSEIAAKIRGPATLIMKSTVPPGTGVKLINSFLKDLAVTYVSNPEFLQTGQSIEGWYKSSRIVIGCADKTAAKTMQRLYHDMDAPWLITDINSAEMIKYASNSFLATKVSFINELSDLCGGVNADTNDVIVGLGLDPRIGTAHLQPGFGYGGPCLPKDTRALAFLAKSKSYDFNLLRAVIEVNGRQHSLMINKLKRHLVSLKGKEIALFGLAFKPGTDDITESPAIDAARLLIDEGANLRVYDPLAMDNARVLLSSGAVFCQDSYSTAAGACAIILATEWPEFIATDWHKIKKAMVGPFFILDGRNALPREKIINAGLKYIGI